MNNMVLITGSLGFIGNQVLNNLICSGIKIRIVLRTNTNFYFKDHSFIDSIIYTEDLFQEDIEWWINCLYGVTTILHSAWYTNTEDYLYSKKNFDCYRGSLILAKAACFVGIKRFICIGTCFEYEMSSRPLSIYSNLMPLTSYAITKTMLFKDLTVLFNNSRIQFCWCRLFYVFGVNEDNNRLFSYIRSKLSIGEEVNLTSGVQIRDYLDVTIVGQKLAAVVKNNQTGPLNICSGVGLSVREIAESIANEFNRRDLLKFNTRKDNLFDPLHIVGIPSIIYGYE